MAKPLPFPTGRKPKPEETDKITSVPDESPQAQDVPPQQIFSLFKPAETPKKDETPQESKQKEDTPELSPMDKDMPSDVNEENCITIGETKIELKPTKLKYFRNKAASGYNLIKNIPIQEFLSYGKGAIEERRDADQILYDFLVAAFDDSEFVRNHYDDMTADDVEKVVKIFGRLNHIDEKEEQARKNREAQAKR